MSAMLKKVKPGDPLVIPAATYNTFVEAARDYLDCRNDQGQEAHPAARNSGIVLVRNDSGEDVTSRQNLIECDGRPAYKCTILGDQILYAHRLGEHFETRRITAPTAGLSRRPNTTATGTFATTATVTTTSAALATGEHVTPQPQASGPDLRIAACLSCPDSRACPNTTTCCGGQVEVNITTPCPRGRW
jgi:hypothetical protein